MLPSRGTLRLYDAFDGEIVLIPSWQWHILRREERYQKADRWRAIWILDRLSDWDLMQARDFVTDVELGYQDGMYRPPQMSDHEVRSTIIRAIEDHRIIAIRESTGPIRSTEGKAHAVELRRLVERIERAGRLAFQGRQYRLVAADGLGRLPSRDRYEVVPQSDARAVLEGMAKESPALAEGLREASQRIGKDWHPSVSEPEGLVLLRSAIRPAFTSKDDDAPVITPSQMKALRQKDWIEIEVVDQDGDPCPAHYRLELADSAVRKGDLGDDALVSVSGVESGACKLTLGAVMLAGDADGITQ